MVHRNFLNVVALTAEKARDYAVRTLGIQSLRIIDITDEGTPAFADEYKEGARLYFVHVSGNSDGV